MAKTKPKGSAKPKTKKADKPRKMTAAELSDTERQRLLLHHRNKLKPLLVAEATAKKAVTERYELAKKEGVSKKELQIAMLLLNEEGVEKVRLEMQRFLDVDRWVGAELGEQLELFAKKSTAEKHFEDGKRAALSDEKASPPAHLPQKDAQRWLAGHAEGQQTLNVSRLQVMKPLGEVVSTIIPPPPALPETATRAEVH